MAEIFVNYRRDDSAADADRLYELLAKHFGHDQIFMDIDHIEPGEDFAEIIQKKLKSVQVAIILIGKYWLDSTNSIGERRLDDLDDYVRLEITEILEQGIPAVQVLVNEAVVPQASQLPSSIVKLVQCHAHEISRKNYINDVNELIRILDRALVIPIPLKEAELSKRDNSEITSPLNHKAFKSKFYKVIANISIFLVISYGVLALLGAYDVRFYSILAERGYANAQYTLGQIYNTGREKDIRRNYTKAEEWYRKAAEQGHADAQYNLGQMYDRGTGISQDHSKAEEWYRKAAEQGHVAAQVALSLSREDLEVPPFKSLVTDLTATLSIQAIKHLEYKLMAFERKKDSQVAVLIIPTIQPEAIEEYSLRVTNTWELGRTKINDGVLLLIAKNDRELRIEVGYGLKSILTNAKAKEIIEEIIIPQFKVENYEKGINDGINAILSLIGSTL